MSRKRLSVLPNTTITLGVPIALGMVVIGFYVLHYTPFGRTVYAIGGSEPSAMLMGLPTLNSGWTRIASGLLVLGFIVMQRVITLGRDRRA